MRMLLDHRAHQPVDTAVSRHQRILVDNRYTAAGHHGQMQRPLVVTGMGQRPQ
ncbi:hypothetical protein D3C78_885880 [compost metagenome]